MAVPVAFQPFGTVKPGFLISSGGVRCKVFCNESESILFIAKILQKMALPGLTTGEHFVAIAQAWFCIASVCFFDVYVQWRQNAHEKSGLGEAG
ncbi:MAG: hypothetical protein AB7E77_05035 [Desulfobulbus sp.]